MGSEISVRLAAEWEPHAATCLSWPHPEGCSFPGETVARAVPAMRAIIRALSAGERVLVNCTGDSEQGTLREWLESARLENVSITNIATNEPWCRDHGPVIVERAGRRALATCWRFTAWGGKYEPYDADARAAAAIAAEIECEAIEYDEALEGGMIDSNGAGVALVSKLSLLDPKRNPGLDVRTAEAMLADRLGIETAIWLDAVVPGDDTDGHVDTYARFVGENRVVISLDPSSPDFARTVSSIREASDRIEIIPVPPPPSFEVHGDVVPASYANFYVGNNVLLLPVFGKSTDQHAASVFSELFPEREVVPIECAELIWGLGAIHCLTCPVPDSVSG